MASSRSRAGLVIVIVSLVIHLVLVVTVWPLVRQALSAPAPKETSMDLRFSEPVAVPIPELEPEPEPEPEPEESDAEPEEEVHLPRDTGEETDLDGTSFDAPSRDEPLAGEEAQGETDTGTDSGERADIDPEADMPDPLLQAPDAQQDQASPEAPATTEEPQAPEDQPPGMEMLNEQVPDTQQGESLVSEFETRRIEMANRYIREMQQQILHRWQRPEGAHGGHQGEIRFSVDTRGRLVNARISRPSGHQLLDISALEAVRSVPRYAVPDRPEIVQRYYQNMLFRYSGAPLD
ncbi:MAG: TonB family protein [Halomonadaceae bacterium]|nr:MAG: TonB family protein [Halomonadaceae bacterium]